MVFALERMIDQNLEGTFLSLEVADTQLHKRIEAYVAMIAARWGCESADHIVGPGKPVQRKAIQ